MKLKNLAHLFLMVLLATGPRPAFADSEGALTHAQEQLTLELAFSELIKAHAEIDELLLSLEGPLWRARRLNPHGQSKVPVDINVSSLERGTAILVGLALFFSKGHVDDGLKNKAAAIRSHTLSRRYFAAAIGLSFLVTSASILLQSQNQLRADLKQTDLEDLVQQLNRAQSEIGRGIKKLHQELGAQTAAISRINQHLRRLTFEQLRTSTAEACSALAPSEIRRSARKLDQYYAGKTPSASFNQILLAVRHSSFLNALTNASLIKPSPAIVWLTEHAGYRQALAECYPHDPEIQSWFVGVTSMADRASKGLLAASAFASGSVGTALIRGGFRLLAHWGVVFSAKTSSQVLLTTSTLAVGHLGAHAILTQAERHEFDSRARQNCAPEESIEVCRANLMLELEFARRERLKATRE